MSYWDIIKERIKVIAQQCIDEKWKNFDDSTNNISCRCAFCVDTSRRMYTNTIDIFGECKDYCYLHNILCDGYSETYTLFNSIDDGRYDNIVEAVNTEEYKLIIKVLEALARDGEISDSLLKEVETFLE